MLQKRVGFRPPDRALDPKYDVHVLAVDFDALDQRANERATFAPIETLKAG